MGSVRITVVLLEVVVLTEEFIGLFFLRDGPYLIV